MPTTDKKLLAEIRQRLESRQFVPLIDREYELDAIHEAYSYVEKGHKQGNVLIRVSNA